MPIVVSCRCGAKFAARDDLAGQTLACPKCSAPLTIRAAGTGTTEAEGGVASILDEIGVRADERGTLCPKCGQVLRMGSVVCQHCKYNLQTATYAKRAEVEPPRGEKFDFKKYQRAERINAGSGVIDEDLSGTDIFLCLVCCPITWMYGLLLFAQGNSTGLKLILMSYLLPLISAFIRLIIEVLFLMPQTGIRF